MHPAPSQTLRATIVTLLLHTPPPRSSLNKQSSPQPPHPPPKPTPSKSVTRAPLIVIGFAGGFIRRTSPIHGEVALASYLRQKYGALIHAEIFENHHSDLAYREILRLLAASNPIPPWRSHPHNPLRPLLGSLRSRQRSPPTPARQHPRPAPHPGRRSPPPLARRLHHPRQRSPGHQLLPDRRPAPRTPRHLRRRPRRHPHHRQHPPHL